VDEITEDNTAGGPEKQTSVYNFTAQEVPCTPNTRIFEDRVKASSPIQQSTQTAIAVLKSIQYLGNRKPKKATLLANTTLLNTTCTPLRDISANRMNTTFTIDIRDTRSAFGSDTECIEVEMT
jgi:hypothetical protein